MRKYTAVFLRLGVFHRAVFETDRHRDEVIDAAEAYAKAIGFDFLYLKD